jgi:hypothetical protein
VTAPSLAMLVAAPLSLVLEEDVVEGPEGRPARRVGQGVEVLLVRFHQVRAEQSQRHSPPAWVTRYVMAVSPRTRAATPPSLACTIVTRPSVRSRRAFVAAFSRIGGDPIQRRETVSSQEAPTTVSRDRSP